MDTKQIENNNRDKIIDGAVILTKTMGRQLMIIEGAFVLHCITSSIDASNNLNHFCAGLIIFTLSKQLEMSRQKKKTLKQNNA